jgi:hypothetical protein
MRKNLSIAFLIFCLPGLRSQLPNTDLWLFKIETDKLKQPVLTERLNITNRNGYDNQPFFSEDGKKIFYVSIREDKQADIYYYDLKSRKCIQFTKTKESEYSPTLTPDKKFMASVVVEKDSAQRIHFIHPELGFDVKRLEIDSVGYYTFLNSDTLIYYKLTQPHSLRYFVKSSQEDKWLCNSPVRFFKAINRHTLIYGLKDSLTVNFYKYDFILRRAYKFAEYPSANEDATWHPNFGLIKSEERKLLRYDESKKTWVLLFDLSASGIKKISRFTFDSKNNYLVVVDNPQ